MASIRKTKKFLKRMIRLRAAELLNLNTGYSFSIQGAARYWRLKWQIQICRTEIAMLNMYKSNYGKF